MAQGGLYRGVAVCKSNPGPPVTHPSPAVEHFYTGGGGVHHLSGIFVHRGGGGHHLSGIFILRGGVHHLSGISIQRGGRTPPQWNIFPQGGGYTTSVEYLSTGGGGGHHLNGIFIQRVGVHHLSGIFFPASHFPQCSIFSPLFFL